MNATGANRMPTSTSDEVWRISTPFPEQRSRGAVQARKPSGVPQQLSFLADSRRSAGQLVGRAQNCDPDDFDLADFAKRFPKLSEGSGYSFHNRINKQFSDVERTRYDCWHESNQIVEKVSEATRGRLERSEVEKLSEALQGRFEWSDQQLKDVTSKLSDATSKLSQLEVELSAANLKLRQLELKLSELGEHPPAPAYHAPEFLDIDPHPTESRDDAASHRSSRQRLHSVASATKTIRRKVSNLFTRKKSER
jgi:hypothetical protein